MKRYEFHSRLTPEQVFSRLNAHAKCGDMSALGDGTFRFKQKKNGFWLTYTGERPATGCIPFWGEVRSEEDGSVITGGFFVWRAMWKPLTAMSGFMCLMMVLFGAPPGFLLAAGLPMLALWMLMCVGFFSLAQKMFFKRRQRAVLEFIERHLLE